MFVSAVQVLPPPPGLCRLLLRGAAALQQQVHQGEHCCGAGLQRRSSRRLEAWCGHFGTAHHLQAGHGQLQPSQCTCLAFMTPDPPSCLPPCPTPPHRRTCWRPLWRWPGTRCPTCGCTWRARFRGSRAQWACRTMCTCWSCSTGGCWRRALAEPAEPWWAGEGLLPLLPLLSAHQHFGAAARN